MNNTDYLYNQNEVEVLKENLLDNKKLGFRVIEHGMILPNTRMYDDKSKKWIAGGGIVDSNGKYVEGTHIHARMGGAYTPPPESVQHRSETVIYLGVSCPIWGHVITDNLRRVWFLNSEIFKSEFKDCPVTYIKSGNFDIEHKENAGFKRLLEILEVKVDELECIDCPTQFDKIILPDESFFDLFPRRFTKEYVETIDRIRNFALKNSTPISNKKLYFYHGLRQIGEERLAEYFKSKGYDIITHEQRADIDVELNLLINCESFASILGSVSHNTVFMRNHTEAIFIPRTINWFSAHQVALNQICSLNATFIDASLPIFAGKFYYLISPQLKRFFGDKWEGYEEEDFKNFLQYVKNCIYEDRAFSTKIADSVAPILTDFMAQLKRRKDLITAFDMPPHWETFRSSFYYRTHVGILAWGKDWLENNQISNDLEKQYTLQAIKISYTKHKIYYSVYYNDKEGWSETVCSPEMAGTTGTGKPICGMKVWLDEAGSKEFDILYRMHKFDGEWTAWAKNGEAIYSYGQKLNAIQINLEPKSNATK